MMIQTGKLFTHIKFVKVYQNVFRIFPLGVHISLQFNEFHLAIFRIVFNCQIKRLCKQFQFNCILSEIWKSVCKLITQLLRTTFIFSAIQIRKFQFPAFKSHEMGQCSYTQQKPEMFQFLLKSTNMIKQMMHMQ